MKRLVWISISMLWCGSALAGVVPVPAPEIDAVAGLAALGLVGAAVSYLWERRLH